VKWNKSITAFLIAIFIDSLGWGVVYPVFSSLLIKDTTHIFPYANSIQLRDFWFELIIAIYCIFMFLSSPVLGSFSDKYGRKIMLMISLWGCSFGFVISAVGVSLNNIWLIIVGRIVSGATAGSLAISQAAIMDIKHPSSKALRLSWIGLANGIGFACGPVLGGFMLDRSIWHVVHYSSALWLTALLAAAGALFVTFAFKETFVGDRGQKVNILMGLQNIVSAFKTDTRFYCAAMLFFMLGWNMFFNEIPIFLDQRFLAQGSTVGFFMAYVAIIFALSLLVLLPRILKKITIEQLVLISLVMQFIFQVLFGLSQHWFLVWLIALPLVVAVPFTYVGVITQISNLTAANHQGRIMGVVGSIVAFTWGLGPIVTGIVAKIHFTAPYYITVTLELIAFFMIVLQLRKRGKSTLN